MTGDADDLAILDVVRRFFGTFDNRGGHPPDLDRLHDLVVPGGVLIKTCGAEPEVLGIEAFLEPRRALLNGGGLVDFHEEEVSGTTDRFGDVAQRWSVYRKAGVLDGTPFKTRGKKTIQLIRTTSGWKITAVAWDDER